MRYISGLKALNLPCSLDTCGDWHTSAINWSNIETKESNKSVFKDWGIELCNTVPENNGTFFIANTLRAILDLLEECNFAVAHGCRDGYICNEKYTQTLFEKVINLRTSKNWNKIDEFLCKEYELTWVRFKEDNDV